MINMMRYTCRSPLWRRNRTQIREESRAILRVYFNYGYAQLLLIQATRAMDKNSVGNTENTTPESSSGSTGSHSHNAYVTIKPSTDASLEDIREEILKALEKRKMKRVSSWVSKFKLVDRKSRKELKDFRPLVVLSGTGSKVDPFEIDMVVDGAPRELDTYKEEEYQVTKFLSYGRRQKRIIRLTKKGIENVRGNEASSQHAYSEVFYTALIDKDVLVISYTDAKEHRYKSDVAIRLVQNINDRVSAFMRIEKNYLIKPEKAREKARKAQEMVHHRWKTQSMEFSPDHVKTFNQKLVKSSKDLSNRRATLKKKTLKSTHRRTHSMSVGSWNHNKERSLAHQKSLNLQLIDEKSGCTRDSRATSSQHNEDLGEKTGASTEKVESSTYKPSSTLRLSIDMFLCGNSVEGSARKRFLKGINVYERKPESLCQVIRKFVDSMAVYVKEHRMDEMLKSVGDVPESRKEELIGDAIEDSLQRTVVNPIYLRVTKTLRETTQTSDERYLRNARMLVLKSQDFFGIRKEYIRPNGWSEGVTKLSMLEHSANPILQLKVLVGTAHSIFESHNKAAMELSKSKEIEFLSADDFFPIFLFVMVNSTQKHPHLNKQLMWGLCSKSDLQGEGGYYLTVYEAAIMYITDYKIEEEKRLVDIDANEDTQAFPEDTDTNKNRDRGDTEYFGGNSDEDESQCEVRSVASNISEASSPEGHGVYEGEGLKATTASLEKILEES
mmetsp:Transcript_36786/g.59637  ORF Transcript_36786/g.59637 Transcript_36786/m.59637 type:complete len:725 (-) Transcript_36786:155-2329(-)